MESGNSGIEPGLSGDVGTEESNSFLPRKVLELYDLSYPLTILPYSLVFEGVSHDMLLIPALFSYSAGNTRFREQTLLIMHLLDLPNEILLLIAKSSDYPWEISCFSQANRHLHSLLDGLAYQHDQRHHDSSLLVWAAKNGIVSIASKMLDKGAYPLRCHDGEHTAMSLAVMNGHVSILELFLERNIPLPRRDFLDPDYDALTEAVHEGHASVVRLIIEHGELPASWNFEFLLADAAEDGYIAVVEVLMRLWEIEHPPDQLPFSPLAVALARALCSAAGADEIEMVQYLLRLGANPNAVPHTRDTPLLAAITYGHSDMLRYLLTHGADVAQLPVEQRSSLFAKAATDERDAKLILENTDYKKFAMNSKKEHAYLLYAAIACESEQHVQELLQYGLPDDSEFIVLPYDQCCLRCGPLEVAAKTGNEKIATLMLNKGASCDPRDMIPSRDPLRLAILEGHENIVKLLLDRGADPNYIERPGATVSLPLILAIEHEPIFKLLLERGADPVNPIYSRYTSSTVMLQAIISGRVDLVHILLDRDVSIEIPGPLHHQQERTSLLHHAIEGGADMMKFLLGKGFLNLPIGCDEREETVIYALDRKKASSFNYLMDQGFNMPVNEVPKALEKLAGYAQTISLHSQADAMFNTLLSRGANINATDVPGYSALWYSIHFRHIKTVEYLLSKGADPLTLNKGGETPLYLSVRWMEGFKLLVRSIDMSSVPPGQLRYRIERCLDVAVEFKQWEAVKRLERLLVKIDRLED